MTAVQTTLEVETDRSEKSSAREAKNRAKFDALALQQLLAPVRRATAKAQRIQLIASAATVVPFVGIVELGRVLLADSPINSARAWTIVAVVIGALLVRTLASGTALTITHFADVDLQRSLRRRIVDTLGRLPLGWFNRETVGRVSQIAVKGTVFVGTSGANLITPVVLNTTSAATVVVGLFFYDWRIGVVALVGGLLLVVCGRFASGLIAGAESRTHHATVEVNTRVIEFARCQPVLRAFGRAGVSYEPLADALETQQRVGRSALWQSVAGLMLNGVAVQAVFSVLIATGAWIAVAGDINPITLVAILGLAARFASPLSALAEIGSAMRMAATELRRITSVLDTPALPEPSVPQSVAAPGRVELDQVEFSYPGRSVLSDISFTAEPGTMTALVGPSGSGKTTITRLIARFYDVDSGAVRVGGVDVREQSTADLMAQLSLEFQDVYLFDDTLWENIRIGRPDAATRTSRKPPAPPG
jgi:ATP-binding cassette subfamily B protein IrtB